MRGSVYYFILYYNQAYVTLCYIFLKLKTFYLRYVDSKQTTGWILCLGESEQETTNDPTSRTRASVILLSSTNYKTIMFR